MLNLYQKFNHRRTSACRVQDPVNGHHCGPTRDRECGQGGLNLHVTLHFSFPFR